MKNLKTTALCVLFTILLSISVFPQKMKPEDIVAKHLDSIGTAEAKFINPKRISPTGKIVLASAGTKTFWALNLNSADYPQEKFGFDGKKVKVNYIKTGIPSTLGIFVQTNETIIEESLFGGALSTSWALLDLSKKKAKVSYEGTKRLTARKPMFSPTAQEVVISTFVCFSIKTHFSTSEPNIKNHIRLRWAEQPRNQ